LEDDTVEAAEEVGVLDDLHVQCTVHLVDQSLPGLISIMQRNKERSSFNPIIELITDFLEGGERLADEHAILPFEAVNTALVHKEVCIRQAGVKPTGQVLFRRTSVEPIGPLHVNLEHDIVIVRNHGLGCIVNSRSVSFRRGCALYICSFLAGKLILVSPIVVILLLV
jgi:hypothetical protein